MTSTDIWPRRTRQLSASRRKQRIDEAFDFYSYAVLGQREPDHAAFGREMRLHGQFDARRNFRRSECGGGDVRMQDLTRIELGDREGPNQIVEVARIALPDRLQILDAIQHDLRVEDGGDVSCFLA